MNTKEEICMAEMLAPSKYEEFYWDSRLRLFPNDIHILFLDMHSQVALHKGTFDSHSHQRCIVVQASTDSLQQWVFSVFQIFSNASREQLNLIIAFI